MEFVGFEVDTVEEVVRLPVDKLGKCKYQIRSLLTGGRRKCTLKELQ